MMLAITSKSIQRLVQVMKRLLEVVLQEKMQSLKKMNQTMSKQDKLTYLETWEALNLEMLEEVGLGMSCREDNSGMTNEDEMKIQGIRDPIM